MNSWRPLLAGPLAERGWQAVEEIAQAIATESALSASGGPARTGPAQTEAARTEAARTEAAPESSQDPEVAEGLDGSGPHQPGLAGGTAGQALFFAYRSRAGRSNGADSVAAGTLLDRSTEALATTPLTPDLYSGFAGVAWMAEHLCGPRFADIEDPSEARETTETSAHSHSYSEDEDDPLAAIDEALMSYLERSPWTADYDLIRGLTGLGVYALERLPRPSALSCLGQVVERLAETAENGPQGITWHTAPELLPDWQRVLFPDGYYNLGVAHGVPGTIAMLGAAAAAAACLAQPGNPLAREVAARARQLVEGAVRWLLAQRLPAGVGSWFGATFSPEAPPTRSGLAWCYGDPGIAAALLVAARACREPAWERFAVDLALDATSRPVETAGVRDAGLCHGSAGLAHLFNRLYQQTSEPRLAEASRNWFAAALDFRQPGLGLAGYRAAGVDTDMVTRTWLSDAGLLEGVAGIGLALLGGLSGFEPAWDRILVLSAATPPPQR